MGLTRSPRCARGRSWRSVRRLLIVGIAALLATVALDGVLVARAQQLYTWTDDNGVTYYTADPWSIPPKYRPDGLPEQPPAPTPSPVVEHPPAIIGPRAATVVQFTPGAPILVTARLNGVSMTLLLDTGADRTLISPAAVARAGYARTVAPGDSTVRILGVTGSVVATQVVVPVLDVAGARLGPVALVVHDAGLGAVDGLLGRDILDAFTVTIDAAAGRATLIPR